MNAVYDVVVVGAGPYGLSIAAHLKESGLHVRIFGRPMQTWREHMPEGMVLKSDGFASNLSDPHGELPLRQYCAEQGLAYDDRRVPVKLNDFVEYGVTFQQRFVPDLDPRDVTGIERDDGGIFLLQIEGDEQVRARRVVLAVGISHFAYLPPELSAMAPELVSHSSAHRELRRFRGEDVAIVGAGASAVDLATLLHEAGANVCILTRRAALEFHDAPSASAPSPWQHIRRPASGLGPGWPSWLYSHAPLLFRRLPSGHRQRIVHNHLGPAGGWAMKERFLGKVPMFTSVRRLRVAADGARVRLQFEMAGGSITHRTGHVIAATGYRPDIARLRFLDDSLKRSLVTCGSSPMLSSNFESSVPGLYFVGVSSAGCFGPLMRFAFGSAYTARRMAGHLQQVCGQGARA